MEFEYGTAEAERPRYVRDKPVELQRCRAYGDEGVIIETHEYHYVIEFDRGTIEAVPKKKVDLIP